MLLYYPKSVKVQSLVEQANNSITDTETLQYYQERINSDNRYVKEYPHKFDKTMEVSEFIQFYNHI